MDEDESVDDLVVPMWLQWDGTMFVDRGLPAPLSLLQKLASLPTKLLQESVEPLQEAHGIHWLVCTPYAD